MFLYYLPFCLPLYTSVKVIEYYVQALQLITHSPHIRELQLLNGNQCAQVESLAEFPHVMAHEALKIDRQRYPTIEQQII